MRTTFKGKNTDLTPALRAYIESKLVRPTEKLVSKSDAKENLLLEIEVSRTTKHHRKGMVWWAEANLKIGKRLIRAEQSGEDPREVIDLVEEELKREIIAYKGKSQTKEIRGARKLKRMMRRPL